MRDRLTAIIPIAIVIIGILCAMAVTMFRQDIVLTTWTEGDITYLGTTDGNIWSVTNADVSEGDVVTFLDRRGVKGDIIIDIR